MFFLGAASNYKARDILRHTFAVGFSRDAKKLETEIAHHYGATSDHVALTSSGRAALALALRSSIPRGSKVVLNGFTCYAVVEAIRAAGCIPIFADVDEHTLNYSATTLQNLLSNNPDIKAFIIQNSLGHPIDITPFESIRNKHHLIMIEDLAHSAGTFYPDGREVGTVGDASALSFGKGKTIDTITGGAVILRNPTLPAVKKPTKRQPLSTTLRARFYPFFGACIRASYHLHLEKLVTGGFFALHFIERSADLHLDLTTRPTYWQSRLALPQLTHLKKSPIREYTFVKNREQVLKKLKSHGFILHEIWYEVPVAPARYYNKLHLKESDLPHSTEVANTIINIPTWYNKSDITLAKKIIKDAENE